MKKLSRKDLKGRIGGVETEMILYDGQGAGGGSKKGYMCCNSYGCSACITPAQPRCVEGAWAVPC